MLLSRVYAYVIYICFINFISCEKLHSSLVSHISQDLMGNMTNMSMCCPPEHTLIVTGTAEVKLKTDLIRLFISVQTLDLVASNSLNKNSQISKKLNNMFTKLGIPKNNITTFSFTIIQSYKSIYNDTSKLYDNIYEGIKVTNVIQIMVGGVALAGDLIDKAISSGATGIDSIDSVIDDAIIPGIKKNLIIDATKNASDKAKLVLDPLGIKIKGVANVIINDYPFSIPYKYYSANLPISAAPTPSISPPIIYEGENKVNVNVVVTFLIEQCK